MGTLRFILALSVVVAHSGGIFHIYLADTETATQIFFIISGFLMSLILNEKASVYGHVSAFLLSRFLRIYSTYYVALIVAISIYGALYLTGHDGPFSLIAHNGPRLSLAAILYFLFINLFIVFSESSLFLTLESGGLAYSPHAASTDVWPMVLIPPIWSVSLELVFYILVPYLVRLSTRWLLTILGVSLAARLLIYGQGFDNDPWTYRFFPLELALFVTGMLSYRAYRRIAETPSSSNRKGIAVLLLLLVAGNKAELLAAQHFSIPAACIRWPLYAFVLIALPCLFAEARHSRLDGRLGDFSYPLYLIHWPLITFYVATRGFGDWKGAICTAIALLCAWVLIVAVERPIDILRHRLNRQQGPAAA